MYNRHKLLNNIISLCLLLACDLTWAGDKQDKSADTNFWNDVAAAVQEAGPEEVGEHFGAMMEATCFFRTLLAEHAVPSIPPNTHGELFVHLWPTPGSKSFSIDYPFRVRADVTFSNAPIGKQIYALQKPTETGIWSVAKGWLYATNGLRIGEALLPSQRAQNEANRRAEEYMKSLQKK